ncbi:MAG: UDP-3-O-(3-hydroxymyristoyl)glucosamine N-acyltransferase [Bacteroidia bacterium]
MEFSAKQIAQLLKGTITGDENVTVSTLSKIEEGVKGAISFLANPAYTPYIYETDASIVILNRDTELTKPVKSTCTLIRVENAYSSFASLLEMYDAATPKKKGIEQPSFIDPTATIGEDCYIGAFAYIGQHVRIGNRVRIYPHCYVGDNAVIGDDTVLFSGVKVYNDCKLGMHCTVHSSTVIGSDGFGFAMSADNNYRKVPQIGNVIIEDHVEIGSNTSIDRATMGSTILRKGVKLDNLIQIAHNVEVGENTALAGGVFIAGSTKVGKNVQMGGQAGVIGHLKIADGVRIAGQSGVASDILKEGEIVQGSPAFPIGEFKRSYVLFRNLQKMQAQIRELENAMKKTTHG